MSRLISTWYFGPLTIKVFDIAHSYIPETGEQIHSAEVIKNDIEKNGLLNPIDLIWDLSGENSGKLQVAKGNQRLYALKQLGVKEVKCYLKIFAYEGQEKFKDVLIKIMPFVRENSGESLLTGVPYKQWIIDGK